MTDEAIGTWIVGIFVAYYVCLFIYAGITDAAIRRDWRRMQKQPDHLFPQPGRTNTPFGGKCITRKIKHD